MPALPGRRPSIPSPNPPPASRRRDPREFNGSLDPPTVARLDADPSYGDGADEPETNRILPDLFVDPGDKAEGDETMTAVRPVDDELLRASQMGLAVRPAMDSITELRAEGSAPRPIDRAAREERGPREAHGPRDPREESSYGALEPSYSEPSHAAPFADYGPPEPPTRAREPSQPSRGSSVISSLPKAAPAIASSGGGRGRLAVPRPVAPPEPRPEPSRNAALPDPAPRGPVVAWGAQVRLEPSDPEVEVGYVEVSNPGAYFSELADAADMNPTKALDLRAYQAPQGGRRDVAPQRVDGRPAQQAAQPVPQAAPERTSIPSPPVEQPLAATMQPGANRTVAWSQPAPQPHVPQHAVHVPQPQRFQPPVFDAYAQPSGASYAGRVSHVSQPSAPAVAATMQQQVAAQPQRTDVKRLAWFVVGMAVGMAAMFVVFGHAQHRAAEQEPARVVEAPSALPPLQAATATATAQATAPGLPATATAWPPAALPPLVPTSLAALPPLQPAVTAPEATLAPPPFVAPPPAATTAPPPPATTARPVPPPAAAVAARPPPARPAAPAAPPKRPAAASQSPANALQPDPEPSAPSTPTNTTPAPASTSAGDLLQNAL